MTPSTPMPRRLARLANVAAALVLAGCASTPTARAIFEPSTDFAQYKTFAFVDPLGTDRAGYRSIVSQKLMAATELELAARGMTRVAASPQLLVNFSAELSEKLRVSTMPSSDLDDIQTAIKAAVVAAFAKYPIAATAK